MPANRNGSKWIYPATRMAIYLRDHFTCVYCGKDLHDVERPRDVTLDHLVPRSKGGTNDPTNLVTCCLTCNIAKDDRPWRRFVAERVTLRYGLLSDSYKSMQAKNAVRVIENARRRKLNRKYAASLLEARRIPGTDDLPF